MLRPRLTAKAEVLSLEDGQEEPPVALIEVEEEPPAEQSFLWEQIASSLDEVELHEVRRVVGEVLVQSLEDVYAEVRALADILDEYSAATNDLVSRADEQRQVLGSPAGGLLQQELRHLLRAALEEERRALLVQAEQLRLSLDDECDYREESAVPPPSVPEMTQLKLALQESLARAEHEASAPALRASLGSRDHERRALNRLKPLPPSEPKPRAPSARDRLRCMVDEAREPGW